VIQSFQIISENVNGFCRISVLKYMCYADER